MHRQSALDPRDQGRTRLHVGSWCFHSFKLPLCSKAIGSKWVFKIKRKPDGSIDRYKVRIVAKGFSQVHQVDYDETFAPVVKYVTPRMNLALAIANKWLISQLVDQPVGCQTAFFYGELQEHLCMQVAQGMQADGDSDCVQLHRSLFGLKQASRVWNDAFDRYAKSIGFEIPSTTHASTPRSETPGLCIC